jgi:hypothetical protein
VTVYCVAPAAAAPIRLALGGRGVHGAAARRAVHGRRPPTAFLAGRTIRQWIVNFSFQAGETEAKRAEASKEARALPSPSWVYSPVVYSPWVYSPRRFTE